MPTSRTVGLVAHDDRKAEHVAWAVAHRTFLEGRTLYATGTTGRRILDLTLPV